VDYLIINNLNKSFGSNQVLFDINFKVKKGEFVSLLGPSGCGKTTILRIINGLETADTGTVIVDGKDITNVPVDKRNIGMVFQNYALFPTMSVSKNIAYGLNMRKKSKEEIKEKVDWALKLVRLEGMEDRKITKLSGGQQQRVALARALVIEPSILLLDEPLSALDRKIRAEMQYELRNIQQKIGITTVFVTHDQEEALTMSDKIILMNKGIIEQESDPYNLYNYPKSIFASDFLGKANIMEGKLIDQNGQWQVQGDGWTFDVDYRGGTDQTPVKVAVRGEHFKISKEGFSGAQPFDIINKVFTGSVCKLIGKIGNDEIEISTISLDAEKYHAGERAYIMPSKETTLYFE
jgi:ABC-type Fe3+/spermidine/putrescine transport system ATPase subunit